MKTKQKYFKVEKHSVLKSQIIKSDLNHTIRNYIPNTKKFEPIHTGTSSQLN
jgi:hypothetical protein